MMNEVGKGGMKTNALLCLLQVRQRNLRRFLFAVRETHQVVGATEYYLEDYS